MTVSKHQLFDHINADAEHKQLHVQILLGFTGAECSEQ